MIGTAEWGIRYLNNHCSWVTDGPFEDRATARLFMADLRADGKVMLPSLLHRAGPIGKWQEVDGE